MTITALPPAPSRANSPSDFSTKADALLGSGDGEQTFEQALKPFNAAADGCRMLDRLSMPLVASAFVSNSHAQLLCMTYRSAWPAF